MERAVLVCETGVIHGHDLPPTLQTAERSGTITRLSLDGAVVHMKAISFRTRLRQPAATASAPPRSITRIVRAGHDPTILFRRRLEMLDRCLPSRARIESVENRPFPIRRVIRRKIQGITLRRIIDAFEPFDDLTLWNRVGLLRCLSGWGQGDQEHHRDNNDYPEHC